MSSTFFIDYTTPIVADWLNDVNTSTYTTVPSLSASVTALQNFKVAKTSDTGSAVIPNGTTAQRDGSPVGGYFRYNNSLIKMEFWNGASWVQLADSGSFIATTGGTLTGLLKFATGTSVASAATVNLSTATGNTVHITGTTGISAWTLSNGQVMDVIFDGVLVLTHHATNNNLPSGANITTAVNDRARLFYDGTTVYVLSYTRADGTSVVGQRMTLTAAAATTSGTVVDLTGIPSWAKRITVLFNGVSTNGNNNYLLQLGTNSGVETTGYSGYINAITGATVATVSSTAGALISGAAGTATVVSGSVKLENHSGNLWQITGSTIRGAENTNNIIVSNKTLAAVLDRIRVTTTTGVDTFDAGSVSLLIEGY